MSRSNTRRFMITSSDVPDTPAVTVDDLLAVGWSQIAIDSLIPDILPGHEGNTTDRPAYNRAQILAIVRLEKFALQATGSNVAFWNGRRNLSHLARIQASSRPNAAAAAERVFSWQRAQERKAREAAAQKKRDAAQKKHDEENEHREAVRAVNAKRAAAYEEQMAKRAEAERLAAPTVPQQNTGGASAPYAAGPATVRAPANFMYPVPADDPAPRAVRPPQPVRPERTTQPVQAVQPERTTRPLTGAQKSREYRRLVAEAEYRQPATQGRRRAVGDRPVRIPHARQAVMLRCAGRCENPDCAGQPDDTTDAGQPILDVDHVDDIAPGGADHPANMVALCPNCHAIKTRGRTRETLREILRGVARARHAEQMVR